MSYKRLNINVITKSNIIDLAVVGLNTLLVILQTLSTAKMFKHSIIKNLTITFKHMITQSAQRCISIFMSSVCMSTSRSVYQQETVLT